jgi:hypothetical protein
MIHPVIRVADTHRGVFLHMTAVLEVLPPEAADLHWTILDLREAFAPEGSDFDVLARRGEGRAIRNGTSRDVRRATDDVARLQQVIDGLFIGCSDPHDFRRGRNRIRSCLREQRLFSPRLTALSGSSVPVPDAACDSRKVTDEDPSRVSVSAWGR